MIEVCIYCDSTDLYTEEEIETENLCYLEFPEKIVREWYKQSEQLFVSDTARELRIPESEATFEKWLADVYTADDTDGLYDFARAKGFQARRYNNEQAVNPVFDADSNGVTR